MRFYLRDLVVREFSTSVEVRIVLVRNFRRLFQVQNVALWSSYYKEGYGTPVQPRVSKIGSNLSE